MIFTIRSLIDPTVLVGGRSEAAWITDAAIAIERAKIFMSANGSPL